MLKSHIWFIVACTLICLICSAIYVKVKVPVYEATATLRIDQGRASSLGLSDFQSSAAVDPSDAIHTEISIIRSDGTALRTLASLSDEEFFRYAGFAKPAYLSAEAAQSLSGRPDKLIENFKTQTTVKQIDETQLINVSYRDQNPEVAAMIVNHLVSAYERQNFDSRQASVSQLQTWLSAQMTTLKSRVETSQKRLSAFQQANSILATEGDNNTITDRLRLLNEQLASAQATRIGKEAQMRAADTGDANALAALFPNPKLLALQTDQGTLVAHYAQLSMKFGPNYPPLVSLKKEIDAVDAEIARSAQSVRNRLQEEYRAAHTAETLLQGQYNTQTQMAYAFNRNQAEYAVLQAEVASSRTLYDTLERKLQQAGIDAEVSGLNTMLVDSARAPVHPIEPKAQLILSSGLILGLFAGIAAAFLVEISSDKLQNVAQIKKTVGYQTLATIPRAKAVTSVLPGKSLVPSSRSAQGLITVNRPLSVDAEAYRTARNAVLLSPDGPCKTLLITSALPGEGSANAAANYAITLAKAGLRVLLVDADLRCPSLHLMFGVRNDFGLSDQLLGTTMKDSFYTAINNISDLFLLTAGEKTALPSEMLASDNFRSLLTRWESNFDHVVIQAAPLLVVSDALPLASWVDGTLLVTRYNITRLRALEQVHQLLTGTDAHVIGVLLTDVPNAGQQLAHKNQAGEYYYA
jgi:capsular exopolysaccharide synthesis family protein